MQKRAGRGPIMSSAAKRRRVCPADEETTSEPPPPIMSIPVHLLVDILARSDAATMVRCAATSKPIRRAILDPEFRRATFHGRFHPAALVGFSYVNAGCYTQLPPMQSLRFDAGLLEAFTPVAVRDEIVVLRRRPLPPQEPGCPDPRLLICNSVTGDTTLLPCAAVDAAYYPPALLTVGDAGRDFELLVADKWLKKTQTFSSKDGGWGAVVETNAQLPPHGQVVYIPTGGSSHHAVILGGGAVVYWLCFRRVGLGRHRCIRALDVATKQVTQIELPPDYRWRMNCIEHKKDEALLLATSADGTRLSLLVSEIFAISSWTLEEEGGREEASTRWTRRMLMRKEPIYREAKAMEAGGGPPGRCSVDFKGFGERSGVVIMHMFEAGLVHLSLGSNEAVLVAHEANMAINCRLQLWANQLGVQLTPATKDEKGKGGAVFHRYGTLCMETQAFPDDAVNHPNVKNPLNRTPNHIHSHKHKC
ncbi:hypothetical protein U9M48_032804 [Paspalum notatum var. saurae]|uniref:DUF7595 domain-containing protein n=1 Tax=Paspalum notatum var. saurae TaxID=547442 RepID=A0AAQ3U5G9_PASNO